MSSYGPVWHFPNFFRIEKEIGGRKGLFPFLFVFCSRFSPETREKWGMVT